MSISEVSGASSTQAVQQSQRHAAQTQQPARQQPDSVHWSDEALNALQGGDADGDGDGQ